MSQESTTVILPFSLGAAANYDRDVFPLALHRGPGSDISQGSLLLSATLEEIVNIKRLGTDLSQSGEFLYNTRTKYEALAAKRLKLQKKKKTINPFKLFLNYRAARVFHAAALTLYRETRETSEKIQRDHQLGPMQPVPSAEMYVVNGPVPVGTTIDGIAIKIRGVLDDDTIQTISAATNTIVSHASESIVDFGSISQLGNEEEQLTSLADTDAESLLSLLDESSFGVDEDSETPDTSTISPSSPQTVNINITGDFYHHSIVSTNSSITGPTINHCGSGNSGASVSQ